MFSFLKLMQHFEMKLVGNMCMIHDLIITLWSLHKTITQWIFLIRPETLIALGLYFCCYSDSEKTLMQQLKQLPAMEAIQKSEQKPPTDWMWRPGLLSFSIHVLVNEQLFLVLVLECCRFLSRGERPGKCILEAKCPDLPLKLLILQQM